MVNIYNFRQIKTKFYRILSDERGATMLEYGLMLASFGFVVAGAMTLMGGEIAAAFGEGLIPSLGTQLEHVQLER